MRRFGEYIWTLLRLLKCLDAEIVCILIVIKDVCGEIDVKLVKEEQELLEARIKEEEVEREKEAAAQMNDTQFSKLDELLTKTQLYSDFLLEKMDDITLVSFVQVYC